MQFDSIAVTNGSSRPRQLQKNRLKTVSTGFDRGGGNRPEHGIGKFDWRQLRAANLTVMVLTQNQLRVERAECLRPAVTECASVWWVVAYQPVLAVFLPISKIDWVFSSVSSSGNAWNA